LEGCPLRTFVSRLEKAAPQQQPQVPQMTSKTLVDYSSNPDLLDGTVNI
jgi:hypothetical protein